jgi:hypothetical protein
MLLFAWISNDRWNRQIAFDTASLFCNVYASSGRILFSIICRLIADHFKMIEQRIECFVTENDSKSQVDRCLNMKKLQHQHALVCRGVDAMNSSFGFILLFEIFFFFVSFTVNSMYFLVISINGGTEWIELIIIIGIFFCNLTSLSIICFSSNLLLSQVRISFS